MRTGAVILASLLIFLTSCSAPSGTKNSSQSKTESTVNAASSQEPVSSETSSAPSASSAAVSVHESTDQRVIDFYTRAADYYTKNDYTNAINLCDEALKIDPLCYEAINIKGAAQYYSTGDPEQGLPLINKCIALAPNYEYGYFNKALIYKGEKDWDTSISLFNKVIELDAKNAWAYYGISTIYADRNMVPESLQYLKQAIDIDPGVKDTARVQNHYDRMRDNPDFQALVK